MEEGDSVEPDLLGVHLEPGQGEADGDGGHQVPLHAAGEDQALPGGESEEQEPQGGRKGDKRSRKKIGGAWGDKEGYQSPSSSELGSSVRVAEGTSFLSSSLPFFLPLLLSLSSRSFISPDSAGPLPRNS